MVKIEVGQEVYVSPAGNFAFMGYKDRPGKIVKVARKYFYVDIGDANLIQYSIKTMRDTGNQKYSGEWLLWSSKQAYQNYTSIMIELEYIRDTISNSAKRKLLGGRLCYTDVEKFATLLKNTIARESEEER